MILWRLPSCADKLKNLQQSNAEAIDLQQNVERVFQEVTQGSKELAALQTEQWDVSHDLAARVQSSLESMRGNEVNALLGAFGAIHSQLVRTKASLDSQR